MRVFQEIEYPLFYYPLDRVHFFEKPLILSVLTRPFKLKDQENYRATNYNNSSSDVYDFGNFLRL